MRKKLPIGIENFEEFSRENFYYADKTMFIAELLRGWGKVNLFTRPRRFGKSLNMSMLKAFFEIGSDRSLFDGLKISREKELCEKHMGKYPVISVTLKSVSGLDYRTACAALRGVVGEEALRFDFLENSEQLSVRERDMYRRLTEMENAQDAVFSMPDAVLADSLRILCRLLEKHYKKKVILLIDEYDVPLDKAFQAGYYDKMTVMLSNLLGNAMKTNDSLQFAVLTGCLRISKESIFTGLNNLKTHTITSDKYDEYFGFTDEDVDRILEFYHLSGYRDLIREWYDGYRFGGVSVYCPWDVVNYCDALLGNSDAMPENYWANTSGNALIRRFIERADFQTRNEIEQLVAGESVVKEINEELTYNELDNSMENLWSVLFSTGYLTSMGRISQKQYRLVIPNREIRSLFVTQIREWFQETAAEDTAKTERFCQAFARGEEKRIEEMLNEYLWDSISVRDTAVQKEMQENFYHGMLLGLLRHKNRWLVRSNAESGEGYSDLIIETPERTGVVIEIKYAQDGDLERGCDKALAQIEEKRYDAVLLRDGMKKVIRYGISFYKKSCRVKKAGDGGLSL